MRQRSLAVVGIVALAAVLAMAMLPRGTVLAQATRTFVSVADNDTFP